MTAKRGGKRPGAGRKPGSVKPQTEKRVVRKLYQWTPDEYDRITQAVQKVETIESKFVQSAVMEKVEAVMADGEQSFAPDENPPSEI